MFKNLIFNIKSFSVILTRKQSFYIMGLILIMIFSGILELIALTSVIPFISIITDPSILDNGNYWFIENVVFFFNIDSENAINFFAYIFICFFIGSNLFIAITQSLMIFTTNRVEKIVINKLFSYYLNEKYLFHINNNSTLFIKNLEKEVSRFADAVFFQFLEIISKSIVTIFILIGLLIVDTKSTLIIFAVLGGIYSILVTIIKKSFSIYGRIISDSYNKRIKLISESLNGIKLLKFYRIEFFFIEIFSQINLKLYNTVLKYRLISVWPKYLIESVLVISVISIIIYNINNNPDYLQLLPTATFFLLAGYRLLPMFQTVFNNFGSIRSSFAAWESFRDDLSKNHKFLDEIDDDKKNSFNFENEIKMENITFEYDKNKNVLHDITITIEKNKITGVTGESGSGKTTLIDIMSGIIDLRNGNIKSDNKELNSLELKTLRKAMGYVTQETYLMDDSIINNIILEKKLNVDINKIYSICKKLNLHSFIENLPGGYAYNIGENAKRFSGGQKQRLGIARALYRDSKILIFDEPTSSLDEDNERMFMDLIKELSNDITIIIISHSLNLKKIFDKTYLLEKGRMINS